MPAPISALIALLGFTLLPGLGLFNRRRPFLQELGTSVAISVAANSFVVMLLALSNAYTLSTGWLWLALALGLTGWLRVRRVRVRSLFQVTPPQAPQAPSWPLLPVLGIVAYKSFALPFFAWDSIASWNRWARAFALDRDFFTATQFFHPQYLSWGMSFPYILSADSTQEWSAHGFSFFCFLILWAGVWRLSTHLGAPAAVGCTAVMVPLGVSSYAGTGYSDIAASGFSCLALAMTLDAFSASGGNNGPSSRMPAGNRALLAGLAAGTAFHYKLLAPLAWAALLPGLVLVRSRPNLGRRISLAAISSGSCLIVVGPWLLSGRAAFTHPLLHYVTTGIHGQLSRTEILLEGASSLLSGTTAFDWLAIDAGVLAAGFLLFLKGCARSRDSAALGVAAVLGSVVWMGTANYDTRALMPFQIVAVLLALSGLETLLEWNRVRNLRPALLTGLQVVCLLLFLIPQLAPDWRVRSVRVIDWQPGRHWLQAAPWLGRSAQLRVLQPALADLSAWREDYPAVAGTLWTNPLLLAELDPTQTEESSRWMGQLEWQGEIRWKAGDWLLVCDFDRDTPKLVYPLIDRLVGNSGSTWGPWIASAERRGVIRLQSKYEALTVYEIQAQSDPQREGDATVSPSSGPAPGAANTAARPGSDDSGPTVH